MSEQQDFSCEGDRCHHREQRRKSPSTTRRRYVADNVNVRLNDATGVDPLLNFRTSRGTISSGIPV